MNEEKPREDPFAEFPIAPSFSSTRVERGYIIEIQKWREKWDIVSEGRSLIELQIRIRNLEVDNENRKLFLEVAEAKLRKIEEHMKKFYPSPTLETKSVFIHLSEWFKELKAILQREEASEP